MAPRTKKEKRTAADDPEAEERARLKSLIFSSNILSQKPAKVVSSAALCPSKTVIKHHGKDILRKSQRKNRYLFSFPGLLGPISGGKIGELKDLGTKNPILYLDFPQGQMKLFGTIVYPKNRYLTLQFPRGGKNVTCDDCFDNMIVFSDAWWIGKREDNPDELKLQFPTELNMAPEKHLECDFKGGVGASNDGRKGSERLAPKYSEPESPKAYQDDDLTDSPNDDKELTELTPSRKSTRTAGKRFNFAEASSGDDSVANGDETDEDDGIVASESKTAYTNKKTGSSSPVVFKIDDEDDATQVPASRLDESGQAKVPSCEVRTPLVQTTLSSLFKKVEEKKANKDTKQKRNISAASKRVKEEKKIVERKSVYRRKSNGKGKASDPSDSSQIEDDDIEEYSNTSQDSDASDDGDWTV